MKKSSKKVREFCARFSEALVADNWGAIEPEVFRNIAAGNTRRNLLRDKMSVEEMADSVEAMQGILEEIL